MRPHRVRLTHSLVSNYGLNSKMYVHRPQARSKEQIEEFHCDGEPHLQFGNLLAWAEMFDTSSLSTWMALTLKDPETCSTTLLLQFLYTPLLLQIMSTSSIA